MLTQETIEKMNAMKLFGMVASFDSQLSSNEYHELSFEERVGILVDSEWTDRERRKLSRRLKAAKLRYPASLENVNFQALRGLNRQQILTLGSGRWIAERHNLLITGPTGDRQVVSRMRLRRAGLSQGLRRLLCPCVASRPRPCRRSR